MKRAFLLLVAIVICIAASAQDIKPAKDKQTKKYGYQNKKKEWVIAPAFDDAKKFDDDGCALVKVDGKYGLIDLEGQWVLPADYEDIGKFDKNGLCELKVKEGKTKYYGVANRTGEVVLPVVFHKVELPKKGGCIFASIYSDEEGLEGSPVWGVYSPDGKEVFSPQFLYSPSVYDDKLVAKDAKTGLEGLVTMDGQTLLPFTFLNIDHGYKIFRTLEKGRDLRTPRRRVCVRPPGRSRPRRRLAYGLRSPSYLLQPGTQHRHPARHSWCPQRPMHRNRHQLGPCRQAFYPP